MRYMIQINSNQWKCFDSEELKENYEKLGITVIDLETWALWEEKDLTN